MWPTIGSFRQAITTFWVHEIRSCGSLMATRSSLLRLMPLDATTNMWNALPGLIP